MRGLLETAKRTNAWACYDCGKCTATCPIARVGGEYSPRRHVLLTNLGDRDEILHNGSVFRCLTCGSCDRRCPAQVSYTDLVRELRTLGRGEGKEPECPHGGALQSMMRIQAKGETRQTRLAWLDGDLETDPKEGDVFYWTGCTMYYDAFFSDYGADTLEGTRAAIRILNRLGVKPIVSPDERCCGHDLLWNGDREGFELLARHNVKLVAESGADVLVVSCAECLRTWKADYAPFFEGKPPKILHLTEYLEDFLPGLTFKENGGQRVTYQDPCRMGRQLEIYDAPRTMLRAVPGLDLVEMRRNRAAAVCCAGGTWSSCDRFSKQIQVERLREAHETGAETLVTACPKCRIHLRCAMKDPKIGEDIEIRMRDVAEMVADALEPKERPKDKPEKAASAKPAPAGTGRRAASG
jgi:Fe-S oxidoreductase